MALLTNPLFSTKPFPENRNTYHQLLTNRAMLYTVSSNGKDWEIALGSDRQAYLGGIEQTPRVEFPAENHNRLYSSTAFKILT
jgi:hypothetical protein